MRAYGAKAFLLLWVFLAAPDSGGAETIPLSLATIKEINAAFDARTLSSEQLVKLFLARIESYDRHGPQLNAVITVNPRALREARALDAERRRTGPRSVLHGISVVVKDNIDTADLPTTAGSFLLKDSIPPDDARVVRQLRRAGAIIIAKVNMGEFASGDGGSLIGRVRNPHGPARSSGGSSAGTGAAIAAAYAMAGLGTDTGGSIRNPASFNGIVGLKPTHGLVSLDGVMPLAASLDVVGPMARTVHDVAAMLSVIVDTEPDAGASGKGTKPAQQDYTRYLEAGALKGARIGVIRNLMGTNPDIAWIAEAGLRAMQRAGAVLVDVTFPDWFVKSHIAWGLQICRTEFREQIPGYLATLDPGYPKTLDELVERSLRLTAPDGAGAAPYPRRWMSALKRSGDGSSNEDYQYEAVRDHAMPLARGIVESAMTSQQLDALVYPTMTRAAPLVDTDYLHSGKALEDEKYALFIANLAGFPELTVPAGFTAAGTPVTFSFLGRALSEPKLLALGYAFERQMNAYRLPATTPPLRGEEIILRRN